MLDACELSYKHHSPLGGRWEFFLGWNKISGNLINSDSLNLEFVIFQLARGWGLPFHFLWAKWLYLKKPNCKRSISVAIALEGFSAQFLSPNAICYIEVVFFSKPEGVMMKTDSIVESSRVFWHGWHKMLFLALNNSKAGISVGPWTIRSSINQGLWSRKKAWATESIQEKDNPKVPAMVVL